MQLELIFSYLLSKVFGLIKFTSSLNKCHIFFSCFLHLDCWVRVFLRKYFSFRWGKNDRVLPAAPIDMHVRIYLFIFAMNSD